MNQEERIKYLIGVYRANTIQKEEFDEFVSYLHNPKFNELILYLMDDAEFYQSTLDTAQDLNPKRTKPHSIPKRKTYQLHWITATAAVLTVLILSWAYSDIIDSKPKMMIAQTMMGERLELALPDGSTVMLNGGTTLKYPEAFAKDNREVTLKGEAFFEVVHNATKPFVVHTKGVNTKVLGTSFNIRSYDDETQERISVATGKVEVAKPDARNIKVTLLPSQQAIYNAGRLDKKEVDLSYALAWKKGILLFEQTSLAEAAKMLKRRYGVDVQIDNESLKHCSVSGSFNQKTSLIQVLENFKYVLGIQYKFTGSKHVYITGSGCQLENK